MMRKNNNSITKSAHQYSHMYTLERGKHQTCREFPASVSQVLIIIIIDNGYT